MLLRTLQGEALQASAALPSRCIALSQYY